MNVLLLPREHHRHERDVLIRASRAQRSESDLSHEDDEALHARTVSAVVKLTLKVLREDWTKVDPAVSLKPWADVVRQTVEASGGVEALAAVVRYVLHYNTNDPDSLESLLIESAGQPAQEAFMTGAEQLMQRGHTRGARAMFTTMLRTRFDDLPADLVRRIDEAKQEDLERWAQRILTSDSLEQIFS